MTIKEYVLDALGKFWNKLKGSYITPMQTQLGDLRGTQISMISNVDANDYQDAGVFQVGDPSTVSNLPAEVSYGFLRVTRARTYIYQEYYEVASPHAVYQRRSTDNGVNWGAWVRRPTQAEVDDRFRIDLNNLSNARAVCEAINLPNRYITQNHFIKDGISDYDVIQLIYEKNGLLVMGRARSDSKYHSLIHCPTLIYGIPITANTDLNTCTTIGTYYCGLTATAATLTNCPTAVAFTMQVSYGTGSGYLAQSIHEYNSARTYFRSCSNAAGTGTWSTWYTPAQSITGGASSIATSNLTASRALISNASGKVEVSSVTTTELGYLSGATSAIQTQINGKQASITGAASSITSSNLATSRVLISSTAGKVAVSSITTTQLGYLSGVTSAIQTQINAFKQEAQTVTASAMPAFGMITGGQKSVVFYVPWYKQISSSTITCSSLKTSLRHVSGGYIGGA